ncbi:hypothetical protein K9F62_11130 [Desulfovibrio sp. JY]|nr:hypothetical protein K9F62_11130 [Desulfovibrio sp. JY]
MNVNLHYLAVFVIVVFIYALLLFLFSVYLNKTNDAMKQVEGRIKLKRVNDDKSFVLKKSIFAFCFTCLAPVMAIVFLHMALGFKQDSSKFFVNLFMFTLMAIGTAIFFGDYFLSMMVISNGSMYVRCFSTLFRTKVIQLDGGQRYESLSAGPFFYASCYMVGVRSNSKSFVFMNVKNKKQLRDVLESFGAA